MFAGHFFRPVLILAAIMLSVLPPYDRPRERESDRPFKAISSRALNQHHNSSPYYSPFSSNSYMSFPGNSHLGKQDSAMDLRPPQVTGMYDQPHRVSGGYGDSGMMDMNSHMSHRMPNVKQDVSHQMQTHPGMSYPNMNPAHSSGYTNLSANNGSNGNSNMLSLRDMGSPPQATLPTLGNNANSPPQSSTGNINSNNSTQSPGLDASPVVSPSDTSSVSPPGIQLPTTIISNPTQSASSSPVMPPKKRPIAIPEKLKDSQYWEKRKKNNESARRSRESRRIKEDQIAMRVVYLEQENLQLRTEVSLLKSEIEKLRCMLYNS